MPCQSPALTATEIDYDALHRCRMQLVMGSTKNLALPVDYRSVEDLPQYGQLVHPGTFLTLYEFEHDRFNWAHGLLAERLKECTNWSTTEFTIRALNNAKGPAPRIIYPSDLPHVVRYNNIVYDLVFGSPYEIQGGRDTYTCRFRIMKNGSAEPLHVERTSSLLLARVDKSPVFQVDVWKIRNEPDVNFVRWHLAAVKDQDELIKAFYEANLRALGIELTSTKLLVLVEIHKDKVQKEMAEKLGMSRDAFKDHVDGLKERLNDLHKEHGVRGVISGLNALVEVCRRYGLIPVPELIVARARAERQAELRKRA